MTGASLQGYTIQMEDAHFPGYIASCDIVISIYQFIETHKHIVYEVLTYRLRWLSVSFTKRK